jgi:group I intron endonuclease
MLNNLKDLDKIGVYEIVCTESNKRYIGSTTQSFKKRLNHHICMLRNNKHKNSHLQRSYNKHGEDKFKINILEIVEDKEQVLNREQIYLDNTDNLFNINPLASGTPNLSKETIIKRAKTLKDRYTRGELKSTFYGRRTWNKGLTKEKHDYSYLKVPKTISDELKQAHKNTSKRSRLNSPKISVYSLDKVLLGTWESSKDLEEWSLTSENELPIKSRFSSDRLGIPYKMLMSCNINKSCKTGKTYKGLIFKYAELKLDELLETPEVDNQQPS